MEQMIALHEKIQEMAERIRELREIFGYTPSQMAEKTDVTQQEYLACERGECDLNFAFIYRCAAAFGVNVTDIIEGYSPRLRSYTVTRAGAGQQIACARGMTYYNLAYDFSHRIAEPLYVRIAYSEEALHRDIELTTHQGQECDIVVSGHLLVQVGKHREVLGPGDSIYYNSDTPHGMVATGGGECIFYAIVLNPSGEPISELMPTETVPERALPKRDDRDRLWHRFIDVTENEAGTPLSIRFKNIEHFNFAFDVVDELAKRSPDKLAMLHLDKHKTERRFTFRDMMRESNRCANYFRAIGIARGDRVMLCLKRHWQFWPAILGLHKIGAVAIPAVNQLQEHDFSYRFRTAGISAVLCTADGDTAHQVDLCRGECPTLCHLLLVGGKRDGWRDFDSEYTMYSTHYARPADAPGGTDPMLMYFTSGTSGYPKIATHTYQYVLGHFHTAKYWHAVNPDGLHLTVSDTGWAKAMWGKLYGQWLCEAATFVYDFDRFDAADLLPMFAKYHITTFCAPPTILRMMIREDLSRFDFSSVEHMTTAGEALNPEVYRLFEKQTGLQIHEGFGQSESTMLIGNLTGAPHKIGSMGKPAPLYDIQLMGADGRLIQDSENGEIVVNIKDGLPLGLAVGYYGDAEKTAETWHDGWYHTGDVAWRDEDGYFWYVGRADDVIKSSGYRIGPFEIESVIMELPYVLECGVSAAPDPVRGQVVKASVVLVPGTEPSEELKTEIQRYVKERTAPYKYPRIVVFRDELPKTASGKIIRNSL